MGRQSKLFVGAVFAVVLSVASASQITLGGRELMQAKILSDLKQAQEAAGIFVDDSDLFLNPQSHPTRKLLQAADIAAIMSNPTVLAALTGLFINGSVVGGFPGVAMNLPGGSPFGYSPTSDSYCLFSTSNRSTTPASPVSAAPSTVFPPSFTCVEGTQAANGGFLVSYSGTEYSCVSAAPGGRKLLQDGLSPQAEALLTPTSLANLAENLLNALGVPVWNCVTATTPAGNTTVGETAVAILNDLGVIAEHFLVQLNSNGGLTYQQQIQNDFVSLTNPLYPTGPRLNFSIDFKSLAKDQALFREIFGFQPPSPPPPAPVVTVAATISTPATATTGGTVPYGSTPTNTGSGGSYSTSVQSQTSAPSGSTSYSSGSSSSTSTSTSSSSGPSTATTTTTSGPSGSTVTPVAVPPPAPMSVLNAFDGYLSNCQVVLGSAPGLDGNFNQVQGFQAVILNGQSSISMNATEVYNNSISYIIPSSKVQSYAPLTQSTASKAQYCYDIATLLPVFNPVASVVVADAAGMSANAITTVAVFGQALGVTSAQVVASLGLTIPSPDTLFTYNAIALAANGSTTAQAFMQSNSAVQNLVTSGANLLSNDSSLYASYAIIMNQALAQKILYSPASGTTGRRLLQASGPPAVDLTNATTLASIYSIALQMAESSSDADTIASLNPGLTQADMAAVSTAVANLNSATGQSTDVTTTQLSTLYGEQYLAQEVSLLATGAISESDFATATSTSSISTALAGTLPGTILPTPAVAAASPGIAATGTFSSSSSDKSTQKSSGGGLSHGGKVALATVFPIVAVIAIVALAAVFISRRNSQSESSSSTVWYRRPFARSNTHNV